MIDCPVRLQPNRVKNFFPTKWHCEQQIAYVKAYSPKLAERVPRWSRFEGRSGVFPVPLKKSLAIRNYPFPSVFG